MDEIVMLSAQRQCGAPNVIDMRPIVSHSDDTAVAVMQVGFPATHRASLVHEARPHIARDIL